MGHSYQQALSDHTYLWSTYGPAEDMTGGYVDQHDLSKLLLSPTKATARDCLISQIIYWFDVGPDQFGHSPRSMQGDPTVVEIAERYDCSLDALP